MYSRLILIFSMVFCICFLQGQDSVKGSLFRAEQYVKEGAFDKAAGLFNEIADYWKKQEQTDSFFYYTYREASQYSNAYEFEKAALLLEDLIRQLTSQSRTPDFLGKVYYRAGSNYVYLNEFEKALQLLDQCLAFEKSRPAPDTLYMAKATEWKGLSYSYLGELDKAKEFIEQALEDRQQVLPQDASEIGYNFNSLGLIYLELNDLEKADSVFSEALRILEKHLPPTHAHLSSIRSNISTIKSTQGDFHTAKSLLEQSIAAHLAEKRLYPLMDDYFNLGALYLSLDDSEHALPYIKKALELADSLLPYPHFTRTNMQDGLAGIYYSTGLYERADSIFRLSLNEKKQLFESGHPEIGRSYYALGLIAKETGRWEEAQELFMRSFSIRSQALGRYHPATADALYGLAELEGLAGQKDAALDKFRTCLQIYEQNLGISNQSYVQTALRMAQLFDDLQLADSLEIYLLKSWAGVFGKDWKQINFSGISELDIRFADSYILNLIEFHLLHLNRKPDFLSQDIRTTMQVLAAMDQLLDKMLPLVDFENSNPTQIFNIQQVYRQGALLIKKGLQLQPDDQELQDLLLYCLDQSRAITIRSAVQNRNALQFANVPQEVMQEDRQLREQMRFLKARSSEREQLTQPYFESLENWRTYQQKLQSSYPKWFELRYDRSTPTRALVDEQLERSNSSLLIYFDLDTSLLVLLMDGTSFEHYLLDVPSSWPDSIHVFQQLISEQGDPRHIASLGNFLYERLWAPFCKKVKEKVAIVPDGALFYLNFETLLSELPKSGDFHQWPWLIWDHTIFYRNRLPGLFSSPKQKLEEVLVVAPAFTSEVKDEYLKHLPSGQSPDSLFLSWLRTPWSVEFAERLAKKGTALIAQSATKKAFLEQAPGAGILHFGTHAWIQDDDPLLSFFALYPTTQQVDDGYLYAYELYNLPLKAQLAVLTACQTGLGEYRQGEGVLSLAHAFQYAGCPSVVYSLWSIDDQQSNLLMEDFYNYMQKGIPYAEALRQAKLAYLSKHTGALSAPYYWGGMVLIGENSTLHSGSSLSSFYWWLPAVLLTFGSLAWFYLRKKI